MPIEKAFAIKAPPEAIWRALTQELAEAGDETYDVDRAVTNQELSLRVTLDSGIRAGITYRLVPRDDHTEVIATLAPEGLRYAIYRLITLGRSDTNYALILVQGLANLKEAAEASA